MKYLEPLFESINDKDWARMLDLVLADKDSDKVAKLIANKTKAISRFVTGLRLKGDEPDWNTRWYEYRGTFASIGNKAIALGATPDEIQTAYDTATIPDKYVEKLHKLSAKNIKLKDRFAGPISKLFIDAGYDIKYIYSGSALTRSGEDAMRRNGRKWTIGYKLEATKNDKTILLFFDAITDEGDGPTSYVLDYGSDNIFTSTMYSDMGIQKFKAGILNSLSKIDESLSESNTKKVSINIPNQSVLDLVKRTDTFNRLTRSQLSIGKNIEIVNHKQFSDMVRLYPTIGVEVSEISESMSKTELDKFIKTLGGGDASDDDAYDIAQGLLFDEPGLEDAIKKHYKVKDAVGWLSNKI